MTCKPHRANAHSLAAKNFDCMILEACMCYVPGRKVHHTLHMSADEAVRQGDVDQTRYSE